MLQAAVLYRLFLDPSPFLDDGFIPAEVNVGRCHIVQTLVVSLVIVVFHEGPDLLLKIAG